MASAGQLAEATNTPNDLLVASVPEPTKLPGNGILGVQSAPSVSPSPIPELQCDIAGGMTCDAECKDSAVEHDNYVCPVKGQKCCRPTRCASIDNQGCKRECTAGTMEVAGFYCAEGRVCCKSMATESPSSIPTFAGNSSNNANGTTFDPQAIVVPNLIAEELLETGLSGTPTPSPAGALVSISSNEEPDQDEEFEAPDECTGSLFKCANDCTGEWNENALVPGCGQGKKCCEIEACTQLDNGQCKQECGEFEEDDYDCIFGGICCIPY